MVLPLPAASIQSGPPPPECAENLKKLKWAMFYLIGTACGRIVTSVLPDSASESGGLDGGWPRLLVTICIGILTLKDDPNMEGAYKCLASTICQPCVERGMGGMQCLLTLFLLCVTGVLLDLLIESSRVGGNLVKAIFFVATLLGQGAVAVFSLMTYNQIRDMAPPEGMEMGFGGFSQPGDQATAPSAAEDQPSAPASGGRSGGNFVPFSGS
eukprot:CAMPEP_0178439788 /NCGR_PEP_ID=MMETSP0689_2-20121128/36369_1 /TAXON_ID=160604 /ORGANISM="Amphidinium massartii, Strain CS-259" /LENGTH=211 /DNA_ID=CAMNT_0020062393 /DNA_START=56 /DNA_END=688 /DNA_ORIENTATION=+